jgi:hypothetical protein
MMTCSIGPMPTTAPRGVRGRDVEGQPAPVDAGQLGGDHDLHPDRLAALCSSNCGMAGTGTSPLPAC